MLTRVFRILLIVSLLIVGFAQVAAQDMVELDMLGFGCRDGTPCEEIIEQFNMGPGAELGIQVNYETVPGSWQEYTQKVVSQIAAGNPPDIINMSPLQKPDYLANEFLTNLTPLMEADADFDAGQWYEPTFGAWTDDAGDVFGFGHGIYTEAVFYNKAIFADAGIDAPSLDWDNSWTWEELADVALQLTVGDDPQTQQWGFYWQFEPGWLFPIFRAFGGNIANADRSVITLDSEGSVAALDFLNELMWVNGAAPPPSVTSATSAGNLFIQGRLGMFLDGSWWLGGFKDGIEDFEWGVLPVPSGPEGTFTGYWVDAWGIPANSDNPQEAWEVIKFLSGEDASNHYLNHGMFGIPGFRNVTESRTDELFTPLSAEETAVWLNSTDYGATPPYTRNWNEVWDMTTSVLQRLQLQELTAEEAGREISERGTALIEQAQ